ncbi:peptidoglycan-binding domain-containing protein [Streptomyces triticirhizae]|uniref:Peptidoglycan-binding protein n=1 Tax=Streptomyces triticirhizae TaxID=2483353 RepID=A0A3M2KYS3_9ACTN|nr:peptidoglycan-binding domain-containing protein [Streptomyces triticirhizae]RMI27468.1 peptidoglycan-binding protein [Streptomyces triticirhizae]
MRKNTVLRPLVGVAAALGIAAGGLAGASGSVAAAPAVTGVATASGEDVSVLAVNNLGLSSDQARDWQCYLSIRGYSPGVADGQLGPQSWKAAQRMFNDLGHNAGAVDGIVGPRTIRALQRYLNDEGGYGLAVDGIAGPRTRAAYAHHVDSIFTTYGC